MFKYPDLLRIKYGHIQIPQNKRIFEKAERIFKDEVVLTEKIDGSQLAITMKGGKPYAQGKNSHIPDFDKRKAYYGVWSWIWANYEKIQALDRYMLFGEWARVQHSLEYDALPDWFIVFDVYDKVNKNFLAPEVALEKAREMRFFTTQIIGIGEYTYDDLPGLIDKRKSSFGNVINEGVVIKNRASPMHDESVWINCAKYVCQEFLDNFEDDSHWTSHRMRENKLKEWKQ